MAAPDRFSGDVVIEGNLTVNGDRTPTFDRSEFTQESLAVYPIQCADWRVWDAMQTNLPGAGATDDLALIGGTFATGVPSIQTGDLKAAGATTRRARCLFQLPPEYVAGETVTLRVNAGMVTTISDGTATIDFEVYKSDRGILVSGSDICATAATTINSVTFSDKSFTITSATLSPGDVIDIRMSIAVSDAATGTAVIGCAGEVALLLDIKG